MRILVLQFGPSTRQRPVPRFEPQLGTLLRLMEERGHDLSLAGLARFDLAAVKAALARGLPQLVYADISAVCVDAARRTLEYIEQHEFLPIVAGGRYPTVDPAGALSLPGVQAVAIGEPDASLATYLERIKDPAVGQVVSGVWLRDERGLERPELPALVEDLDSLPAPQRELFGYAERVGLGGSIEIAAGRGCPQSCGYCANACLRELYAERGEWVRRRSPEDVLDEIAELRDRYPGVQTVRLTDHALALDADWLAEFLEVYRARCGLPFRCHVRANSADRQTVSQLVAAGCQIVDVEVISGSNFIRNEVFDMDLDADQVREAFARLGAAGIHTRAIVYLGAPYESDASLDETRKTLHALKPDLVDIRPYYPFPGTAANKLAREQGWLHARGEEQYHADRCGVDMPACRADVVLAFIRRLRMEFPAAGDVPWWRRWSNASRSALGSVFRRPRL